jgi:hypothetical protein
VPDMVILDMVILDMVSRMSWVSTFGALHVHGFSLNKPTSGSEMRLVASCGKAISMWISMLKMSLFILRQASDTGEPSLPDAVVCHLARIAKTTYDPMGTFDKTQRRAYGSGTLLYHPSLLNVRESKER